MQVEVIHSSIHTIRDAAVALNNVFIRRKEVVKRTALNEYVSRGLEIKG
jgi:hypothetical protein